MSVLCDKCKINPASVHMQQNINGQITEFNLCQFCAEAATSGELSFDHILKSFMNSLMGFTAGYQGAGKESAIKMLKCPQCGQSYEGFQSTGKLGCAGCYSAFRPQLVKLFNNVHGSATHNGKIPAKSGVLLLKKRELDTLKKKLNNAIVNEAYEEAAVLRDRIKELDNSCEKNNEESER